MSVDGEVDTQKVGKYSLEYSVTDDEGEVIKTSRTITVVDGKTQETTNDQTENEEPKITGSDSIRTYLGEEFDPKFGITATDKNGKDITELVTVEGEVKTNELGSYELKYSVSDELGKTATFNRKVSVINKNVFNTYIEKVDEVTKEKIKQLGFSIYLDTKTSKFVVENQSTDKLNPSIKDEVAFKIRVLDKDNKEKLAIELLGEDTGDSEKLNALKELEYSYGDFIEIHPKDIKEGFNIDGPILGDIDVEKEDYTDGLDNIDCIQNVRFKITEEGIESIYNKAPEISGLEVMDKLLTDRDKQLEGVKVTDDHDKDIPNDEIQIIEEKDDKGNVIGLRYTVSDSWGRNISELRLLKSKDEEPKVFSTEGSDSEMTLSKNSIEIHGIDYPDGDTLRFKLKFNQDTRKIEIVDTDGRLFDNKVKDKYFELVIYDKYGNEKERLTINGSDRADSKEISNFKGSFSFGDQIHLYHKYSQTKLKIEGEVKNIDDNLSDGIDSEKLLKNRFELDSKGLKYLTNKAPEISWTNENRTITRGEKVDLLDDVRVTDDIDGEIDRNRVSVTDYDTSKLGKQTVTYTVKDSWGEKTRKERTVTILADTKLSNTSIDVMTTDGNHKVFSIKFDDFDRRISIVDGSENKLDESKPNDLAFRIRIFSKAGITKKDIELNGSENGLSEALDELDNYRYTLGDTIQLWSSNPETGLKIIGEIEKDNDITEDYNDGIGNDDFMNNVRFELQKNTLHAKYNEAPSIQFKDDLTIKRGEEFDPLSFIEKVKDDYDNINTNLVRTSYKKDEIHKAGDHEVEYKVSDKWGKSTSVKKTIKVLPKNKLEETKIKLLKEEDGTKKTILTLHFDDINKKIVKEIVSDEFISGDANTDVFKIIVFDSSNNIKAESTIKANEGLNNSSLKEVLDLELKEDDTISVSAYSHDKVVIDGEVTNNHKDSTPNKKYENGFENEDKMNNTRFRLTPDGFKELYNEAPQFEGVENTSIVKGQSFDKLSGVSVTDDHDVDIQNSKITVTGDIDKSKLGPQTLTYKVSDSWGRTTQKTRTVTVESKAVENKIELKDSDGSLAFRIGFDFVNNKFTVSDQSSNSINPSNKDSEFFIAVAERDNKVVKTIELKGTDAGNSEKLDDLKETTVRTGFKFFVWSKDSNRLSIKGHIDKDSQITEDDYSNGVTEEDFIRNVGFTITEDGLKAVYNQAPEILISSPRKVDNKITLYKGDDYRQDLLNLVGVNDDHDGAFTKEIIKEKMNITLRKKGTSKSNLSDEIELDKVKDLGEYIATYTIKDSWGRSSSVERDVEILTSIDRNEINFGTHVAGKDIRVLGKLGFDSKTMKFVTKEVNNYDSYLSINVNIYNSSGELVHKQNLPAKSNPDVFKAAMDKLGEVDLKYGYYITFHTEQKFRISIDGPVRNGREDYSDGIQLGDDLTRSKFYIKEEGLTLDYEPLEIGTEESIIEYVGTNGNIPFRLKFNHDEKSIQYMPTAGFYNYGSNADAFRFKWVKKSGETIERTYKGGNPGNNNQLNDLKQAIGETFEDGDYIEFWSYKPENVRVYGKLADGKDYSSGVESDDILDNTRFTLRSGDTEDKKHLDPVYNEAPKFTGVEDVNIYVGGEFDPRKNVEVTDDHDKKNNQNDKKIDYGLTGSHDNTTVGKYTYTYKSTDSWNRETVVNRNVYVRPEIFKNRIMLYAKEDITNEEETDSTDSRETANQNVVKPAFEIGVYNDTGKYTVTNQLDKEINPSLGDDVTFKISVYESDGSEKVEVELNGIDKGTSPKLEKLKDINYSSGDYIRVWSEEPKYLRVTGEISSTIGSSGEDYNDGIDDEDKMNNVVFRLIDDGMSMIYNKAPQFENLESEREILFGERLNLLEGVTIYDEIDGNIDTSNVTTTGEVNKDEIGSYPVTHEITDSWGRITIKEVTYKVVSKIKQNSIEIYDDSPDGDKAHKFTLKFNTDTNKIDVENMSNITKSSVDDEVVDDRYFEIVVRNRDTNVKAKVTINKDGNITEDKLNELEKIMYSNGDTISIYSKEKSNIRIKGNIEKSDGESFDEKFPEGLNFDEVRFKITNKGLELFKHEFPNISFGQQNLQVTRGDKDTLYKDIGLGFTNEDSYQGIDISINNFDILKLGTQKATYVVKDSWGNEVSKEREITVVEPNELEKNKIKLLNGNLNQELFEFEFDTIEKEIVPKKLSSSYTGDKINLLTLKIYDESGVTKDNITVTPQNIDKITERIEFDYGDYISISAYDNKKGLSITGTIKGQKEDYSNGVDTEDNIVNVRFKIEESGLESVYNNAPVVTIKNDLTVFKDESPDLYEGVDVKDQDDHDKDIDPNDVQIDTELDITHMGEYTATYKIADSWGRESEPVDRNINVKSSLENNKIGYYPPEDTKKSAFDITIDNKNNQLKVQKNYTTFRNINKKNASQDVETIFEVKLFDKDAKEKKSLTISSNDDKSSVDDKINEFNNTGFEYGDYISVFAKDNQNGIKILGNIDKPVKITEDYSDGIQEMDFMNNVRFRIDEEALEAVYNEAPKMTIPTDTVEVYKGDDHDFVEGIKSSDDHDVNLRAKDITISDEDKNKFENLGEHTITLTLIDSWGRQVQGERTFNVKTSIDRNEINFGNDVAGQEIRVGTKIGFDSKSMKIIVKTPPEQKLNLNYALKIFNSNDERLIDAVIGGEVNQVNSKLEELKAIQLDYGYYITLDGGQKYRMSIDGPVRNQREDYSDGIQLGDDLTTTKFYITESGLRSEYTPQIQLTDDESLIEYVGYNGKIPLKLKIDHKTKKLELLNGDGFFNYDNGSQEKVFKLTWTKSDRTVKEFEYKGRDSYSHVKSTLGEAIKEGFTDGDYLTFYSYRPKNIRMRGQLLYGEGIEESEENFSDGIDKEYMMTQTRFYLNKTENGIKKEGITVERLGSPRIEGAEDIAIEQGTEFNKADNVRALDFDDNDLTSSMEISGDVNTQRIGVNEVVYKVTNSNNITETVTRNINVYSTAAITMIDQSSTPYIEQGTSIEDAKTYLKPLAQAIDPDGNKDISERIKVDVKDLNTELPGTYKVTYSVINDFGEESTLEKDVQVGRKISVSVPTQIPFQVVTNLLDENADPFISGVLKITNNNTSEVDVSVKSFTKKSKSGDLEIVDPNSVNDWDNLSREDSMKKMALGMYVKSGINGKSTYTKETPLWLVADNTDETRIGILPRAERYDSPHEARLSFTSKHGKNFMGGTSKGKFELVFKFE